MPKKPSGLRDEEPHRPLSQFQYLFKFISKEPQYSHEGGCWALLFPDGGMQFIHIERNRSFLFGHMRDLARFLNAKLVMVNGTWTFTPNNDGVEVNNEAQYESVRHLVELIEKEEEDDES